MQIEKWTLKRNFQSFDFEFRRIKFKFQCIKKSVSKFKKEKKNDEMAFFLSQLKNAEKEILGEKAWLEADG